MTIRSFSWFARYAISCLILVAGLLNTVSAYAQVLRPEVHKSLFEAQEAVAANDVSKAIALIVSVLNLPDLTQTEKSFALRSRVALSVKLAQWPAAIDGLQQLLRYPEITDKERMPLIETLIFASQKIKNYDLILEWASKYVSLSGAEPAIRSLLIQTLSMKDQHKQVIDYLQRWDLGNESAKNKPQEADLRALARAYQAVGDKSSYYRTLKLLLKHYPSEDYWADAIYQLMAMPTFNSRLNLEAYRLLENTGNLKTNEDYSEMISLAMTAGLPFEANRLIEIWYKNNSKNMEGYVGQYEALRSEIKSKVKEDETELERPANKAQNAGGWYAIGLINFSKRDWTAASAAFEKSFKTGKITRESERQLRYGLSLAMEKRLPEAFAVWSLPFDDDTANEIALLWRLLLSHP